MPSTSHLLFLGFPAAAATVAAIYIHNYPLPAARTRTIHNSETLSTKCASSYSLNSVVNPRHHKIVADVLSINLLPHEISGLTDEEVLARFTKGFFDGWVFTPERIFLAALRIAGRSIIPVGFSGVKVSEKVVPSIAELSRTRIPPLHSVLFSWYSIVLDISLQQNSDGGEQQLSVVGNEKSSDSSSYVDIAFGDDRRTFAGMHRFEVMRTADAGATLSYSSVVCNPTINKTPVVKVAWLFHKAYAMALFRDGIAGVLKS